MRPRREPLSVAALVAGLAGPLAYVCLRLVERLRGGVVDPTLLIVEARTGFYWRALTATWWAVLAGALCYALLAARPASATHRMALGVGVLAVPLAAVLAALMWLAP